MDDIVKQAMAKWPNVPACYGWLGLDGRGQWFLRDDEAQACGGFASGIEGAKGNALRHDKLIEFINRNYLSESDGCWFFQNGPQRVYVELQYAPWVWRLNLQGSEQGVQLQAHAGQSLSLQQVSECVLDEAGSLYLATPLGLGLVHTQDMLDAAQLLEQGLLPHPVEISADQLPERFGFVRSPQQAQTGQN